MLIFSGGMEDDLAAANTTLKSAQRELDDELSHQGEFNDVADNLKLGLVDLEALAKSRKTELEELRAILGRQGLLSDSDRQSSQDVNSDLQSFIRLYRDKLPKKGIKIKGAGGGLGASSSGGSGERSRCGGPGRARRGCTHKNETCD